MLPLFTPPCTSRLPQTVLTVQNSLCHFFLSFKWYVKVHESLWMQSEVSYHISCPLAPVSQWHLWAGACLKAGRSRVPASRLVWAQCERSAEGRGDALTGGSVTVTHGAFRSHQQNPHFRHLSQLLTAASILDPVSHIHRAPVLTGVAFVSAGCYDEKIPAGSVGSCSATADRRRQFTVKTSSVNSDDRICQLQRFHGNYTAG